MPCGAKWAELKQACSEYRAPCSPPLPSVARHGVAGAGTLSLLNPFPTLFDYSSRVIGIYATVASPPRAVTDRSSGTVDQVWVPTKYTKPLSTTARRRTRPLPPQSGPGGGRRRRPDTARRSRDSATDTRATEAAMVPTAVTWVAAVARRPRSHRSGTFHV